MVGQGLNEQMQECAGNLLAELHDARFRWQHGELTTEQYTRRIQQIKHRREAIQAAAAHERAEHPAMDVADPELWASTDEALQVSGVSAAAAN